MKYKILIADDEVIIQEILKELIKNYFDAVEEEVEIFVANDGVEAVNCFLKEEVDVVFMDINMPKKDGFEAIRDIRLSNKKQPVILIITFFDDNASKEKGFVSGANWYITKPIETQMLELLLNDIIAKKPFLQNSKKSIVPKKISAKEFMEKNIFEFNLEKLEIINEKIEENLANFIQVKDFNFIKKIADLFEEYSKILSYTKEFSKIALGLFDLSEILRSIEKIKDEFFIDFLYNLLDDLKKWEREIFIEKSAIDIHYLDDSLNASIFQLKTILKSDENIIEEDVEFF